MAQAQAALDSPLPRPPTLGKIFFQCSLWFPYYPLGIGLKCPLLLKSVKGHIVERNVVIKATEMAILYFVCTLKMGNLNLEFIGGFQEGNTP